MYPLRKVEERRKLTISMPWLEFSSQTIQNMVRAFVEHRIQKRRLSGVEKSKTAWESQFLHLKHQRDKF
jgi:hypothetical protein